MHWLTTVCGDGCFPVTMGCLGLAAVFVCLALCASVALG